MATNRRHLRVFTVGGVQREVISLPGHVVAMAALGPRLAIVYQTPPCEFDENGCYMMEFLLLLFWATILCYIACYISLPL